MERKRLNEKVTRVARLFLSFSGPHFTQNGKIPKIRTLLTLFFPTNFQLKFLIITLIYIKIMVYSNRCNKTFN